MLRSLSLLFVILWSSAFISSKIIVDNSSPFISLGLRFIIVAIGFFLVTIFIKEKIFIKKIEILKSFISGILFHGLYLGGCFYAISIGLPASIAALIVSMQPILTNILSGPILNEKVSWKQWIGILFGFVGVIMVLGIQIHNQFPTEGLISIIIALISSTAGVIWQKKVGNKIGLSVNNFYQALGGSLFLFIIMFLIEDPYIKFSLNYILSMSWQILAVSFGAFTILMYLIKKGSASKTSNLFFLVPPVTSLMAWLILDEIMTVYDIFGLIICSVGVFISTKEN